MSRKRKNRQQSSGQPNKGSESGRARLLFAALVIALLAGAIVFGWSRNSAHRLARIRELGQHDPVAAVKLLDKSGDRSRDGLLLRCRLLAAAGDWDQAEDAFEDLAEPELCGSDELIDLASRALGTGNYSLADKVLDAAFRRGDHQPQLLGAMIDVKHKLAADQEALPLCEEMSRLAPRDPYPWLMSAQIYHRAEKIDLAIQAYREALDRDPDARRASYQIADLAIYAGDLDAASEQLDRLSIELPDDPDVGVLRARLLHRQGDLDAGLRLLDGVLASQPDMVSALLERGVLQLELGNFAEATRDLKQVVALAPDNYTAHYKLGLAYQRLNQPDLARRHLARSSQITDEIAERKRQDYERRRADDRTPTP